MKRGTLTKRKQETCLEKELDKEIEKEDLGEVKRKKENLTTVKEKGKGKHNKCRMGDHLKKKPKDGSSLLSLEGKFEGNYLISQESLTKAVYLLHSSCPPECISITDVKEERSGHDSAIKFSCTKCDLKFYINDPDRKKTCFRESKKINSQMVLAADLIGVDQTELKKFCAVLGIDGPPDDYEVHQKEIYNKLKIEIDTKLKENRKKSHTLRHQ